jgi:hypothetical protein
MNTKDFELREWRMSDAASLAENADNIRIWNNVRDYFPHPYSEEDGRQFIEMVLSKPKPATDKAIVNFSMDCICNGIPVLFFVSDTIFRIRAMSRIKESVREVKSRSSENR